MRRLSRRLSHLHSIERFLSVLAQGHIPKQLNPASAAKLRSMFKELTNIISKSAPSAQEMIRTHAKIPFYQIKCEGEEKNNILRERVFFSF